MSTGKKVGGGGQGLFCKWPLPPSPKPPPPTPYGFLSGRGSRGQRPRLPRPPEAGWEGGSGGGQGVELPGPPPKQLYPLRICVPVVEATVSRARRQYLRAARKGLWAEIRLDYLEQPDLKRLFRTRPGPVVVTNRRQPEGGRWTGAEGERLGLLGEALTFKVNFLDVELATDSGWRGELWGRREETRLILSWHDFFGTPEMGRLDAILEEMLAAEADILKIVSWAQQPEDNLRVLSLIPKARARGREIIAFCMGPAGKWSRIVAPFLGSYLTYAPFSRRKASAAGQLTVQELRRLWRSLK